MPRRRRWLFLVPVLCIACAYAVPRRLPVHSGKTVAEWFEEPDVRSRGATRETKGVEAFLELRGDAVPFLTRTASKGPNWWSQRYAIIFAALPESMQRLLPTARTDGEYRERQTRALWLLGTLCYWDRQPSRPWGKEHPSLRVAKVLRCLRECLEDPAWSVRLAALDSAAGLGPWAAPLLPEIGSILNSPNENLRVTAIKAVGEIGPGASNRARRLTELLSSTNAHEVRVTIESLGKIGPEAAGSAAPALVPILESTNTELQRDAALCFAQMGTVPAGAAPLLEQLTNSGPSPQVRQAALLALWTQAPANPALTASLSNAVVQNPSMGLSFLYRVRGSPHAGRLAPMVQSFTNHNEPHVRRSAAQWLTMAATEKH